MPAATPPPEALPGPGSRGREVAGVRTEANWSLV